MMSNLFGRATNNLVLLERLKAAYEAADYELKVVADIQQRSLLPHKPPHIPAHGPWPLTIRRRIAPAATTTISSPFRMADGAS